MALQEQMEDTGHWFFRWRSYLPLLLVGLLFSGLPYFEYPFGSHFLDQVWEVVCLAVSAAGVVVRALTVGSAASQTSGRNTKVQVARTLNTTGMYSIVRNPLYVGNFLTMLGVVVFLRVWWITAIYALLFALYYERIVLAEEAFLRRQFGRAYLDWAARTPAFLPRFRLWTPPAIPVSWKKAVRREYPVVAAVVAAMYFLEEVSNLYLGHGLEFDPLWVALVSITGAGYVTLRLLHKRSRFFKKRMAVTPP